MTKDYENDKDDEWNSSEKYVYSEFGESDMSSIDEEKNFTFDDEDDVDIHTEINNPIKCGKNEQILRERELELQQKEMDLQSKYNLINNILTKMQDPLTFFDDQLIHIIQDIIKKVIIKIIHKEITTDPTLIVKMVDGLKSLINTHDGLINLNLSEEDYKALQNISSNTNQSIHVDKNLTSGDIVIKTNDTEIRALLNERIDLLMGTLHE